METIVSATIPNYGKVGFGCDIGYQLVPLIHHGFSWQPKLRAWLTMDLSFHLVVWGFVLALHKGNGGDLHGFEGKIHLDFMSVIHFCFVAPFVSIFTSSLCWFVCR